MKNIFEAATTNEIIARINKLTPETQPLWGKMDAAKMLAHCCVTYEMVYTNKHPKAGPLKRYILKLLVKPGVVNTKPYPKNSRTAPQFIIADERVFEAEKKRLVDFLEQTQKLGEAHFDGKESNSFGAMTIGEWNNQFYKHLDHHLTQFGV